MREKNTSKPKKHKIYARNQAKKQTKTHHRSSPLTEENRREERLERKRSIGERSVEGSGCESERVRSPSEAEERFLYRGARESDG